jgi:enoyl-CoA hydratase/carnithine racemase
MDAGISVSSANGVCRLRLTRPESRNSLTRAVCAELRQAFDAAAADSHCRALVIEGSGGAFASGADISELNRLRAEPDQLRDLYRELRATQEQLYRLPQVTLAVVDGYCMGAGLSLALACDLRLASARSVFAASPARIGLLYSERELWRLVLHTGVAHARDLMFSGRRVAAEEALRLGLVERISAPEELPAAIEQLLAEFNGCALGTLRKTKAQLLRLEQPAWQQRAAQHPAEDDAEAEQALFGADAAEGMLAFLERRAPRFIR